MIEIGLISHAIHWHLQYVMKHLNIGTPPASYTILHFMGAYGCIIEVLIGHMTGKCKSKPGNVFDNLTLTFDLIQPHPQKQVSASKSFAM